MAHVGQDETVAGKAVGEQLKAAGVKNAMCVIQEAGNVGLEQRCAGVKESAGRHRRRTFRCDINDLPARSRRSSRSSRPTPSIDGVLTLGPAGAVAIRPLAEAGSTAKLATFDLNADVAEAIQTARCSSPSTSSRTCRATCRSSC